MENFVQLSWAPHAEDRRLYTSAESESDMVMMAPFVALLSSCLRQDLDEASDCSSEVFKWMA